MAIILEGSGTVTGITTFTTPLDDIKFDSIEVTGIATASTFQVGTGVSIGNPRLQNLSLYTNDTEFVTVDNVGNVGFGTTNAQIAAQASNAKVINAGIVTANQYFGNQITAVGARITGVSTFTGAATLNGNTTFGADVTFGGASSATALVWDKSADDLIFQDDTKAIFGAGSDLSVYHDGSSTSYINNTSSYLRIRSSEVRLSNTSNSTYFSGVSGGAAKVYFNDAVKIETTNSGTITTGIATVTNLHSGSMDCTGELNFTGNGNKFIDVATLNGSNTLTIRHQDGGSYETAATFTANGAAALQFNGGTKLATTAVGVNLKSGAANTSKVIIGNTANRGLEITTVSGAGNNDAEVVFNAADTENSGYHANLVFQLADVEKARFNGNGDYFALSNTCTGITFGGDYADANRLDDYEEGLYTATLTCLTSGTITVNSSIDQLAYTKIGRVVYVNGRIRVSAVSSPSGGQLRLNLPFASAAGTENSGRVCGWVQVQLANEHMQDYDSMPTAGGNTYIQIGFSDTTNSTGDVCATIIVGTYISCNFFYTV